MKWLTFLGNTIQGDLKVILVLYKTCKTYVKILLFEKLTKGAFPSLEMRWGKNCLNDKKFVKTTNVDIKMAWNGELLGNVGQFLWHQFF